MYDKELDFILDYIRQETRELNDVNLVLRQAYKILTSHYLRKTPLTIPLEKFEHQLHENTRLHLFNHKYDWEPVKALFRSDIALNIVEDLILRGDAIRSELQRSIKQHYKTDIKRTTLYDYLVKLELSGWISSYRIMKGNIGNLPTYFYYTGSGKEFYIQKNQQNFGTKYS